MKRILRILFSRIVIVSSLILVQLSVLFVTAVGFTEYFVIYYFLSVVLALGLTLRIVNRKDAAEYKIAWLVTVLLIPVFGSLLYLIFSGNRLAEYKKRKMTKINSIMEESLQQDILQQPYVDSGDASAEFQSRYITEIAHCPVYQNTRVEYFPLGDDMFPVFLEKLKQAERYIFLEYFIIAEGKMWNAVTEILQEKAKAGIDVRVIYDDMGCIMHLPKDYARKLESMGIRCQVFNRFIPILSARLNNRDHRKIGIIDGKIAFTGGVNFADEYINEYERFGHWKDNAVMLCGDAAWSMTVMFLTMWDYLDAHGTSAQSYVHYRPQDEKKVEQASGWIQPYTDTPLDSEAVGETIYLNMIHRVEHYIWITTPYLIIDELLENALCTAAKCGIDVRIITPGIGDKFMVYEATKSYYLHLIQSGVKIYEYTPGFIHAKTFLCDDRYATVGTVNLDFRSLYLHFECGVWMYQSDVISDIREDFEKTLNKCRQITEADCHNNFWRGLFRAVLALLAPMM